MNEYDGLHWLIFIAFWAMYFLPLIVANARGREGQVLIGIGNFFLGWTVIGWIVMLIVACTGASKREREQRDQLERLIAAREGERV